MEILEHERVNLTKLMNYLFSLPEDFGNFGMSEFHSNGDITVTEASVPIKVNHTCGTSACAVGTAPLAGVEIPEGIHEWFKYSLVTLCNEQDNLFSSYYYEQTSPWDYLFSSDWENYEPSHTHAAERIKHYLDVGPDGLEEDDFPWLYEED